ncbi:MAG: hypothetical protein M0Z95_20455, partial [Actinomycetota bacterium]|nr:hypothetical protein [Actinomycetota bacterium]
LTQGVAPSLHVDYKRSFIKQYFKLDRAIRTELTVNDATLLSSWRGPWTSRWLYFLRCDKGFIA